MSTWRTAFVGDPMRFRVAHGRAVSGQDENITWLRELIALPAGWTADLYPTSAAGPAAAVLADPDSAQAVAYRQDPEAIWATHFATSDPSAYGGLVHALADHDLVIGFELPPGLRRALHDAGARYVNLSIHPLRFLQDLMFGVTSNDPAIQRQLQPVDSDLTSTRLRRFRALLAKRRPAALAFPADLPVLIGQTEADAILIDNGRFSNWPDHEAQLNELLRGHPAVVFSEHPLRVSSQAIVEFLRHRLGKTVITTDANGYGFVFRPVVDTPLITLSSSLGVEAMAAGHPVAFLLGDPRLRPHLPDIEPAPMVAVGHALLDESFWLALAQPGGKAPPPRPPFHLGDDHVRSTLESWSYKAWRDGLTGLHARKTLLPGPGARPSQLRAWAFALSAQPVDSAWPAVRTDVTLDGARPLALGEARVVDLGQGAGAGMRGIGLHTPEGWGVWSSDWRSTFPLCVDDEAVAQGCDVEIELSMLLYEPLLAQCPVALIALGQQTVVLPFRPATGASQTARLRCHVTDALMVLQVELSRLGMPGALAGQGDTRHLGLAFTSLSLRCVPADTLAQAQPVAVTVQDVGAVARTAG